MMHMLKVKCIFCVFADLEPVSVASDVDLIFHLVTGYAQMFWQWENDRSFKIIYLKQFLLCFGVIEKG